MIRRRLAAFAALALGLAALVLQIVLATIDFRRGVLSLALLALSVPVVLPPAPRPAHPVLSPIILPIADR
jgi:hypothetical protein